MEKGAGRRGGVARSRASAAKKMVGVSWPYRMLFLATLTCNLHPGCWQRDVRTLTELRKSVDRQFQRKSVASVDWQ